MKPTSDPTNGISVRNPVPSPMSTEYWIPAAHNPSERNTPLHRHTNNRPRKKFDSTSPICVPILTSFGRSRRGCSAARTNGSARLEERNRV
jgi:hypothetical protein